MRYRCRRGSDRSRRGDPDAGLLGDSHWGPRVRVRGHWEHDGCIGGGGLQEPTSGTPGKHRRRESQRLQTQGRRRRRPEESSRVGGVNVRPQEAYLECLGLQIKPHNSV
ncbi:hypothetical protein NDU88_002206 [Pleurodeles waltl]|uniref:Uncharacterized protein n=1 Tax=Pleurodeles waltl TaxID=8319 RepID=A0AAV7WMT8_PLEWA|nr:hypothetical protein NDU88_002206 [Pleurodeles waltl]